MLTWNPELAELHPEWLVVNKPGAKSRSKPDEVSEEQKAFTNTQYPGGGRFFNISGNSAGSSQAIKFLESK
jgi:hypothetical protein